MPRRLCGGAYNIAKHYPQQIAILKERISGMEADIRTAKENFSADKEQFTMKVGDKLYTEKKEAGTALVEMCKAMKTVNVPATVGEYAGFRMSVSFDSFNHKFVMNLKGQLSHNLEIGADPLGNISRYAEPERSRRTGNYCRWQRLSSEKDCGGNGGSACPEDVAAGEAGSVQDAGGWSWQGRYGKGEGERRNFITV